MQGHPPDRVSQPLTSLQTPFLSLEWTPFLNWAHQTSTTLHTESLGWWPDYSLAPCSSIDQHLQAAGATGIACSRVNTAERLAATGLTHLLITLPPATSQQATRLVQLVSRCELLVVVDHYYQAQTLSDAAQRTGATVSVLIEVNLGRDELGIRAGHDALRFAQGIVRLPALRLQGLFGRVEEDVEVVPSNPSHTSEVVLGHCASVFRNAGLPCERVFSTAMNNTHCSSDSTPCQHVLTDLVTTRFTDLKLPSTDNPAAVPQSILQPLPATPCHDHGKTPFCLWATVLSRSHLERAVIDVGHTFLGTNLPTGIRVRNWPDAALTTIRTDYSTLSLGPLSQRLRIGDRVALLGPNSLTHARPAPGCVITEGAHMLDIWPWDVP